MIAGEASAQNCCMSCKYCCYEGSILFQVQNTCSCHPFVKLCNDIIMVVIEHRETLDHLARGKTEKCRFNIIPLTRYTIQFISFPEFCEDLVLLTKVMGKVDKENYWSAGNIPSSGFYPEPFSYCPAFPIGEK